MEQWTLVALATAPAGKIRTHTPALSTLLTLLLVGVLEMDVEHKRDTLSDSRLVRKANCVLHALQIRVGGDLQSIAFLEKIRHESTSIWKVFGINGAFLKGSS